MAARSRRPRAQRLCLAELLATAALLRAVGGAGDESGPDCWTNGITRGQCCNFIHGRTGNNMCWDGDMFTFDSCCKGKPYRPRDCSAFITHFSFQVVGYGSDPQAIGQAWERCASEMEARPEQCNSANTSARSCPACALLSEHLTQYIRCVRQEQKRPAPAASCPACCSGGAAASGVADDADGGGSLAIVGGQHWPTLLRPRSEGRTFSLLASAFDMTVGHQLISEGSWMQQEVTLLKAFLPHGGIAVDAGANIGGFALPLSRHVGPEGQVHAFEPFRNIFQILTANCAMNGLLSCYTYHNALGNSAEKRERRTPGLNAVGNPSKSFVVDQVASELLVHYEKQRTEVIEVVRLDDKLDLPRLDVIKIDVESSEYEMLLGAEKTIGKHQPVIYVEDSEGEVGADAGPTRVVRLLTDRHGYQCLNLADYGLPSMTSTFCAPKRSMSQVNERLSQVTMSVLRGL